MIHVAYMIFKFQSQNLTELHALGVDIIFNGSGDSKVPVLRYLLPLNCHNLDCRWGAHLLIVQPQAFCGIVPLGAYNSGSPNWDMLNQSWKSSCRYTYRTIVSSAPHYHRL